MIKRRKWGREKRENGGKRSNGIGVKG